MSTTRVPLAGIAELASAPNANLLAIRPGIRLFDDFVVKEYASRKALEAFLKTPGSWTALVKNPVSRSMLIYPAFQRAD